MMKTQDADVKKGSIEDAPDDHARPGQGHNRLSNQLPHRHKGEDIDDNDTDFPEPGSNPEHS
jgi:hypothetical protein